MSLMFLFLSSGDLAGGGALQEAQQLPGNRPLEGPADLPWALP
jgi:hypothetical protein